jgi:hypothetical protein
MSYARKGLDGSEVYVYASWRGRQTPAPDVWICHDCALAGAIPAGEAHLYCSTPHAMLTHLMRHRDAGHTVPDAAIERLRREAKP